MIGEEIGIVAEVIQDAEEGMIEEAVRKVVLLQMFIPTFKGVDRKNYPLLGLQIQVNLNDFGMVFNGLFVLHNRYRQPICK